MTAHIVSQQTNQCRANCPTVSKRNQHTAAISKQFLRMPIGRGNYRFATAKGIGEGAGGDLIAIKIGGDVNISHTKKIL